MEIYFSMRMKRVKNSILIAILFVLIVLGFTLYKNYPYIEAYYYNRYINISGVKLMMTEEELAVALNERREFVPGMGGNGWRYGDIKIFVSISSHGMFRDKVCQIDTENSSHDIMGIKVGDSIDAAVTILKNYGFKEIGCGYYKKGNVHIQLSGRSTISRLRINIIDPAYKNVAF